MVSLYVHLIPQTTSLIQETLKLSVPAEALINDLRLLILDRLNKSNVNSLPITRATGRQQDLPGACSDR